MRSLCLLLAFCCFFWPAQPWTGDVRAAGLSRSTLNAVQKHASVYGISEELVRGVLNEEPQALLAAARDCILPKAVPEKKFGARYDHNGMRLAISLLVQASTHGNAEASRILLSYFELNIGQRLDSQWTYVQIQRLLKNGDSRDLHMLGSLLFRAGRVKEALNCLEQAIQAGEPDALHLLTTIYASEDCPQMSLGRSHACAMLLSRYEPSPRQRDYARERCRTLEAEQMEEEDELVSQDFQKELHRQLFARAPLQPVALAWLSASGKVDEVQQALDRGTDANMISRDGIFPLLEAAANGRGEIVRLLLQHGAAPDVTDQLGGTALMWSVRLGELPAVSALLKAGAATDKTDRDGRTALHWAALFNDTACAEALLAAGCSINTPMKDGSTPLILAAKNGHTDMVDILLAHKADSTLTDAEGRTALSWAAAHPVIAGKLVAAGVAKTDLASAPWGPALAAVRCGNTALMESMLKLGLSPYAEFYANESMRVINRVGNSLCFHAAASGQDDILRVLKEYTYDFKPKTPEISTALDDLVCAIPLAKTGGLRRLTDISAYAGIVGLYSHLLLSAASVSDNIHALKILLNHGADVNSTDKQGRSVLYMAADMGGPESIRFLLENGAEVNVADKKGETPLFQVLHRKYMKKNVRMTMAKLLLEAGADPRVTNENGISALDKARQYPEIFQLMQQFL